MFITFYMNLDLTDNKIMNIRKTIKNNEVHQFYPNYNGAATKFQSN